MNTWSYSQLVKDHGEERALELLATMKGYGEFRLPVKKPAQTDSNRCILCGEMLSSKRRCGPA